MDDRDRLVIELLAVRCRRGDPDAVGELLARFERPLLFYLRRLPRDEADAWDCLQETWIAAVSGVRRLRTPGGLSPFLYRVARNKALAHLRRRRREAEVLADAADASPAVGDADDAPLGSTDAQAVRDAIDQLPLPHRDVLTLFFLEDLSVAGVADVLAIPAGTVKSRLYHAKRALRAALEGKGFGHG